MKLSVDDELDMMDEMDREMGELDVSADSPRVSHLCYHLGCSLCVKLLIWLQIVENWQNKGLTVSVLGNFWMSGLLYIRLHNFIDVHLNIVTKTSGMKACSEAPISLDKVLTNDSRLSIPPSDLC